MEHLNGRRYGLIWEEHEEAVDLQMRTQVPVFTEVTEREIAAAPGENYNFLLEGDNLHSLHLLRRTHKGRISVIYIDPPYNTGKNDFVYEDEFVDTEDKFKHSKWLSFMERRMRIAFELLSDDGLLFVSIDDNEQANLKLLLDDIFGERNFVIMLPRITKKSGKTTGSFSKNHDYVLVYTKGIQDVFVMEEHRDPAFCHEDEWVKERGRYKLNQTLDYDSLSYSASLDYPLEVEGEIFYPGSDKAAWERRQSGQHRRADWAWRWNRKLFDFGYKNGFIVIKRKSDGSARIYTKTYLNAKIEKDRAGEYHIVYRKRTKPMSSLALAANEYSNDNAKKDLAVFDMKDDFDYSKPTALIKRLLKSHYKKDGIILDFFAGSGTTAQAVLELNAEDGGHRSFILCTNNQNKICEEITYKRCRETILSYVYENQEEELLFEHRMGLQDLKRADGLLAQIDQVKAQNQAQFSKFRTEIRQDFLRVYGVHAKKTRKGLAANLKYYRTDWVDKSYEGRMGEELLSHVKEMIQLEQGNTLKHAACVMVQTDEEADALEANWQQSADGTIYLSREVLLTAGQERLFAARRQRQIPDCYFAPELKEVGEAW
ncbi:MAG: site-specific DNA-methyltransferase [Lachnospiraceae bacterium]